jgi:hypothetical protein
MKRSIKMSDKIEKVPEPLCDSDIRLIDLLYKINELVDVVNSINRRFSRAKRVLDEYTLSDPNTKIRRRSK